MMLQRIRTISDKLRRILCAAGTVWLTAGWLLLGTYHAEAVSTSAKACILMEAVTGKILYEQNAYEERPMASTTKIMSALLCLESGDLDTEFVVNSDAIHVEGSSMGLVDGDIVTKRALCYGMLLPSGNDAAGAAAVKIAGSYEKFADMMNARAAELGMTQTHFVTPSGLHDENHYSTAYDMALLTAKALQNETFREICSQSKAQISFGNPPYDRWLTNSNKLLTMDETVIGVKTGFTDEAGRCLVSACCRDGVTLICVTLFDRNDWQDHLTLYDYGFRQVTPVSAELPRNWTIPVTGGETEAVSVQGTEMPVVGVTDGRMPELQYRLEAAPFLYAPVTAGQQVGTWSAWLEGRQVLSGALYASEDVAYQEAMPEDETDASILERFLEKIKAMWKQQE